VLHDRQLEVGGLGEIQPYDRVAEVSTAVRAISLEAGDDDSITVHWQDESGTRHAVLLDKDRTSMQVIE